MEKQNKQSETGEHYFSEHQSSTYNPILISIKTKTRMFELYSASGVFSQKQLDKGTEVLLQNMDLSMLNEHSKVLDLGCGYGVVGISILLERPSLNVWFVDSSKRAITLTKKNIQHMQVKGTALQSDVFSAIKDQMFDLICTNPPYNAGRDICFAFIEESYEHLNTSGSLQLVCRRRKGGDVLEQHMQKVFGNVSVIGQKGGFRLYKSVKDFKKDS
jgi:16S rRNA (guanine1207-N2)-methyltransferase